MKKYILIISFLFGFLISFVLGYNNVILDTQSDIVSDAVLSKDVEFFLKFNKFYNEDGVSNSSDFYLYEVCIDEEDVGYNIIIFNIEDEYLTTDGDNDEIVVRFSGVSSYYDMTYYASAYNQEGVFNQTISNIDLISNIGSDLLMITLYSLDGDVIFYSNLDIDLTVLNYSDISNMTSGYSDDEIKELTTISNFNMLIIYLSIYFGIVVLIIIIVYINKYISKKAHLNKLKS